MVPEAFSNRCRYFGALARNVAGPLAEFAKLDRCRSRLESGSNSMMVGGVERAVVHGHDSGCYFVDEMGRIFARYDG